MFKAREHYLIPCKKLALGTLGPFIYRAIHFGVEVGSAVLSQNICRGGGEFGE